VTWIGNVGTNVRNVIEDKTPIFIHFLELGQFIGFAGSWSTGSSQYTSMIEVAAEMLVASVSCSFLTLVLAEAFSSVAVRGNSEEGAVTGSESEVLSGSGAGSTRAGNGVSSEDIIDASLYVLRSNCKQKSNKECKN
jgi:hypothetical protein